MLDNIIGSVILEFIGALARWVIYAIINTFRGKKIIGFKEIWAGRKGLQKADLIMYGVSNVFLGFVVIIGLLLLLNNFF